MEDTVLFDIRHGVALITLNRPKVFNSVNQELAFRLIGLLDQCRQDPSVRAIRLTGVGKAFCAGQDLQEVVDPQGPSLTSILRDHYNPIVTAIRGIEKPVVCAVNGVAAGAGANIALACDITLAATSASFIQAFSKIGLIPDSGGTYFLPRLVGLQKATALAMLGDKLSADEAEKMGLIYRVVPDEALESESILLAERLAQMPTKALGLTKRAFNEGLMNNLSQQLELEQELQTQAGETSDFREGVQAFLEKRTPVFTGA
jgi:2-(1,2-epoxy-1,2-dihydrophenyl)acetyl-CoA isomerase